MSTRPSCRLRHIGTGLGLEERVDVGPLAGGRVGSVRELNNKSNRSDPLKQGTQYDSPTLRIQHRRTDVAFHAVFILAILPLFARIVTQHNTTFLRSHRRGMRISTRWVRALQIKFADSGRLWSFWRDVCRSLLSRGGSGSGLDWLRGDNWRSGNGWRLGLRAGLLVALELLATIIRTSSPPILLLLPLLVRRNEVVVHSVCHRHLLEPWLARHKTTRRDHPHSSSHLSHQRHLIHHHLLEYQWVCHLSGHSCIHVDSWNHSVLEYRRHWNLRLLLLLRESGATRSHSFEKTPTWVSATLTVTAIAKHCTRTRGEIGAT